MKGLTVLCIIMFAVATTATSTATADTTVVITSNSDGQLWLVIHNNSTVFNHIIKPADLYIEAKYYSNLTVFNQTFYNVNVQSTYSKVSFTNATTTTHYNIINVFMIELQTHASTVVLFSIFTVISMLYFVRRRNRKAEVLL